jgi:phospholipid/cholesterol/gamma-HCH transport system substrate-binding protein
MMGRHATMRALALVALAVGGVLLALVVLAGRSGDFELRAVTQDASQLVDGDLVKVGGVAIGKVTALHLTDRDQAELVMRITDHRFIPLHEGTTAIIRASGLAGVANRYVALTPGPNDRPALADGATIGAESTQSAVDLDIVLDTLDSRRRAALQQVVHGLAGALGGREQDANRGLEMLDPAISQIAATAGEVDADEAALRRLVVEAAAVAGSIAPRHAELEQGIADAAATAEAAASRTGAIDALLRQAPPTLREATVTAGHLRDALREVRPDARLLRPVAPRLATVLRLLRPVARGSVPALAQLRALLPDLAEALRGLPSVARAAVPAFATTVATARELEPIVAGARVATPDVLAGINEGFGGTAGGYYDANGDYARIAVVAGPFSGNSAGDARPPSGGARAGNVARCPGAATQPAPDRSNPVVAPELPCDPRQVP